MGQVIDFVQARSSERRDRPVAPAAASWPGPSVADAQHLLEPSWTLWRSLVASYASFWFAPLGIEVRLGGSAAERAERTRLSSGR